MLTRQQKRLLDIISSEISANGFAPSFEEMKERMGLRSKSGIWRLINALEERGYIRRLLNRARAIELVDRDGDSIGILLRIAGAASNLVNVNRPDNAVLVSETSFNNLRDALRKWQ